MDTRGQTWLRQAGARGAAGTGRVLTALSDWDRSAFRTVAVRHWPRAEGALPRLSRSADHGKLWLGLAAGIAASGIGGPRARRGARRGLISLATASAVVNTLGKGSVRRSRPVLDEVPLVRQLKRLPQSTSFPSGHSASAAAFATGVALESRGWGAALLPVAAAVGFSRVYTGVHYPSDVLTGAAIGAASAVAVRAVLASRKHTAPAQPLLDAPALPAGRGLSVVANPGSGSADLLEEIPAALPAAEVTVWRADRGPLTELLEKTAQHAAETGGALGVFGGDGTVNAAARAALQYGVPLAVLPGGTYNHLAQDLAIATCEDTARAVREGQAVALDMARFTPGPGAGSDAAAGPDTAAGPGGAVEPGAEPGHFVNTFSLGAYGELVEVRERWERRVGPWAAGVLAAVHVLRHSRPFQVTVNDRRRSLWLLFAGNCSYSGLAGGTGGARRLNLADSTLDIHLVRGGRLARTRLVAAALTGLLHRSPVHAAARGRRLRLDGISPGTVLSYDGETAPAPEGMLIEKEAERLTVYRPLPEWLNGRTLPGT